MPTPVELALTSLLPTLNTLPPELLDLATSLLAQSRSKAASLKPDEEIGRIYACCHIACDRLRNRLALEVSKPAPPCKPRVYTKLLAYLQSALAAVPTTPKNTRTVRKPGENTPQSASKSAANDLQTPSRRQRRGSPSAREASGAATPTTAVSSRKRKADAMDEAPPLPDLTMPVIRKICAVLGEPRAAPHVLVGLEINARTLPQETFSNRASANTPKSTSSRRRSQGQKGERQAPISLLALIAVLALEVTAKMQGSASEEHYQQHSADVVQEAVDFATARNEEQFQGITVADLQKAVEEVLASVKKDHLDAEWFRSVPTASELDGGTLTERRDEWDDVPPCDAARRPSKTPLRRKEKHSRRTLHDGDEDDDPGPAGLLPGLATMFQPALDWLSDDRRAEYEAWKRGVLRQVSALEQRA